MTVLQITSRYPPFSGGLERHVAALATGLVERQIPVSVHTADRRLFGGGDPAPAARETRDGVTIRRHRAIAPRDTMHIAPGILGAVRQPGVSLIHAHNYHSVPLVIAALGKRTETPLVLTPHYHGGSQSRTRDQLLDAYTLLGKRALNRADAVIAVSDWEREQLAADFDVDATVIPNGIDVDRFVGATPTERDRPYLFCVGRLERYKNVEAAIRALDALPEFDLLVAGSGPDKDRLASVATDIGVEDRVAFLGYVAEEQLPGLYAGATVHLQLSSFEAFGITVGESLAAGTPCVVHEAGALVDWTDRPDCIGVTNTDSASIATAVATARNVAPSRDGLPTWAEAVDAVESLYRQIGGLDSRNQT